MRFVRWGDTKPQCGLSRDAYIERHERLNGPEDNCCDGRGKMWDVHHPPMGIIGVYAFINECGYRYSHIIPAKYLAPLCVLNTEKEWSCLRRDIEDGVARGAIHYGWDDILAVWVKELILSSNGHQYAHWTRCDNEDDFVLKVLEIDEAQGYNVSEVFLEI